MIRATICSDFLNGPSGKLVLGFLALCATIDVHAVTYFRPTIPGTQADSYTRPGMAIDGDRMYQTYPGTDAENVTKPGWVREGNTWVETLPSSTARKAKGRNFNVYGSDGRMFLPAPVEKDDYDQNDRIEIEDNLMDDF